MKRLIKPHEAHDMYLTKERQLQGKVDWLIKHPEAWDMMCEWWTSKEFNASQCGTGRADRASRRCNAMGQTIMSTRPKGWYDTHSLFSSIFHINLFVTLAFMLQKKSIVVEPYYLDVLLPAHDDESMTKKLVSNNITWYA
jgi:hypothetical protein